MINQSTGDLDLLAEMMCLAEGAVQFHGDMSGDAMLPEAFIRDWVAVKLHEKHKLTVTVETGRANVLEFVIDKSQHAAHASLDLKKSYRLDMIVWENDKPIAIVEFKRSTDVAGDLGRTAAILSVANKEGLSGYVVACLVIGEKSDSIKNFPNYRTMFENERHAIANACSCGSVQAREPIRVFTAGDDDAWCGILGVQLKHQPRPHP